MVVASPPLGPDLSIKALQSGHRAAVPPAAQMHRQDAVPAGVCDPLPLPPVRALQPALLQGPHAPRIHAHLSAQLKGTLGSIVPVCVFFLLKGHCVMFYVIYDLKSMSLFINKSSLV